MLEIKSRHLTWVGPKSFLDYICSKILCCSICTFFKWGILEYLFLNGFYFINMTTFILTKSLILKTRCLTLLESIKLYWKGNFSYNFPGKLSFKLTHNLRLLIKYNWNQIKPDSSFLMKQNAHFWPSIKQS